MQRNHFPQSGKRPRVPLRQLKNELCRNPLEMKPSSDPQVSRILRVCAKERFMSLWHALGMALEVDMLQTMLEVWSQAGMRRQERDQPFRPYLLHSVRS